MSTVATSLLHNSQILETFMLHTLKSISIAARERAELSDPHGQRCLIENASKKRAIHLAHVIDRELTTNERVMTTLEWTWVMAKGTLNLDTRENIFFLGAALNELYEDRRWCLLPEESVVRQFVDEIDLPKRRHCFPKMEVSTFRYTILALDEMDDIILYRQDDSPSARPEVTFHYFPYDTFPTITSHIHPKYVILQLGLLLTLPMTPATQQRLKEKIPWLYIIRRIYAMWMARPPDYAYSDPTFITHPQNAVEEDSFSEHSSKENSVSTPPRRIKVYAHPRRAHHGISAPARNNSTKRKASTLRGTDSLGYNASKDGCETGGSGVLGSIEQGTSDNEVGESEDSRIAQESTNHGISAPDAYGRKRHANAENLDPRPVSRRRFRYRVSVQRSENKESDPDPFWTTDRISAWVKDCLPYMNLNPQ